MKWNHSKSDQLSDNNGMKQGGVVSLFLFTLNKDPFIHELKMSRLGCYVDDKCAFAFLYADDYILLNLTKHVMQKLSGKCSKC